MRRLRVGFVGAGFAATFHIRGWMGVRDADIVAICDRHHDRAGTGGGVGGGGGITTVVA